MIRLLLALGLLPLLAGCAGMNRAVGVLPNTLDDLGARRAAAADAPNPAPAPPAGPSQPGDAALAVRP